MCDSDAAAEEPEAADTETIVTDPKVEEKKALKTAIAELEPKLVKARGELLAAQDAAKDAGEAGYMLLAANFERYRQQAASEMKTQKGFGRLNTLRSLLDFVETFEALQAERSEGDSGPGDAIHSYYGGIYKQLLQLLEGWGVTTFDAAVGEKCDWKVHERVEGVESSDFDEGVIMEVQGRGWKLGDETLRGVKVVVSTGASKPTEPEPAPDEAADDADEASGDEVA